MPYYTKDDDSLVQPPAKDIPLEYSVEGLRRILEMGAGGAGSKYSHFDIIVWCQAYSFRISQKKYKLTPMETLALNVADDVHGTWDIYLYENFADEVLLRTDVNSVRLPESYWEGWLSILSAS